MMGGGEEREEDGEQNSVLVDAELEISTYDNQQYTTMLKEKQSNKRKLSTFGS